MVKSIRKLFFPMIFAAVAIVVSATTMYIKINFFQKQDRDSWSIQTKYNETITFKWYDLSSDKEFTEMFQEAGEVFANAFSPLYMEAGLEKFFKNNPVAELPLPARIGLSRFRKKNSDREILPQEKEAVGQFMQKNKRTLLKYSKEYFLDEWNKKERIKIMKELSRTNRLFFLTALKNDKPVGFALFSDTAISEPQSRIDWKNFLDSGLKLNKNEKFLWILAIDPDAQKRGLGRILTFSIVRLFPNTDTIKLKADISTDLFTDKPKNENAYKVYEHLGFERYNEDELDYNRKESQFFVWKKKPSEQ